MVLVRLCSGHQPSNAPLAVSLVPCVRRPFVPLLLSQKTINADPKFNLVVIVGSGLSTLETSANPYIATCGPVGYWLIQNANQMLNK